MFMRPVSIVLALPLLALAAHAQTSAVASYSKISSTSGGFAGPLDHGDLFGSAVASLGDLDGDGNVDLAVGAPSDDDGGPARGAVWILFLDENGEVASTQKISSLEEISIFTETEDIPLKEVFKKIHDLLEGEKALSHKSTPEELKDFFDDAVPDYDKERVYVSDIKKVIQWYNILHEKEMLDFTEEEEASGEGDGKDDEKNEKE